MLLASLDSDTDAIVVIVFRQESSPMTQPVVICDYYIDYFLLAVVVHFPVHRFHDSLQCT